MNGPVFIDWSGRKIAIIHPLTVSGSQHGISDRNTMPICRLCVFCEVFIRPRVKVWKWISVSEEKIERQRWRKVTLWQTAYRVSPDWKILYYHHSVL